jgi:hypothetical protein
MEIETIENGLLVHMPQEIPDENDNIIVLYQLSQTY